MHDGAAPGLGGDGIIGGMAQLFVLVPAPALGPASWQPVAGELAASGRAVIIPSAVGFAVGGPPYWARLVSRLAAEVDAGPGDRVVLVPHSGAGVLAGQLAAAIGAGDTTVIFTDAALPGPDGGGPVVGTDFLPYLRKLAQDGLVPPWDQWWPDEDLSPLFPDESTRTAVLAEAGPLPLAFCEEELPPAPGGWPPGRAGYLMFSAAYQDQAAAARRYGWPVSTLPGEHLHMLVRPADVAAAITRLARS